MARFSGTIGFVRTEETAPDVWSEISTERKYSGNTIKDSFKPQSADKVNDNLNISNKISVVADSYARENFQYMRYVGFMGAKWRITDISVEYPRLLISIGGIYNGK